MKQVMVHRPFRFPDPFRWARCEKSPELGPQILFFSGGTALRQLSRTMIRYTHNSIHLITPFDSGGSSAELRKHFAMPAVGDFRNRLMALADKGVKGNPKVFDLFAYRFPGDGQPEDLEQQLEAMIEGDHPLVSAVFDPMRTMICRHLGYFLEAKPASFDLRGASIGNLILVGGYLKNEHKLDPVLLLYSDLVKVRGLVRPIVEADLHLCAQLNDGRHLCGQHRITNQLKHGEMIDRLLLSKSVDCFVPAQVGIDNQVRRAILDAELICYPMGSFFTSVIATLLPEGIGRAVAANAGPKVYVPNTGIDRELNGYSLEQEIQQLLRTLGRDTPQQEQPTRFLNFVLLDSRFGSTRPLGDLRPLKKAGIQFIELELIKDPSVPQLDPTALIQALLSLT